MHAFAADVGLPKPQTLMFLTRGCMTSKSSSFSCINIKLTFAT